MRLPRSERALVTAVATVTAYVVAVVFVVGVGLWSGLGEADRAALGRVGASGAVWLAAGTLLVVAGVAVIVARLLMSYVTPARQMTADVRLMTSTNRERRLRVRTPSELASLAAAVNELADRSQASEEEVAARVEQAQAELAQERNRLAALMAELTIPVLVCTVDGRILLYNQAARELLSEAYVGLGRSVFGVVDRGVFAHLLDQIATRSIRSNAVTTSFGDRLLRVHVTPIATVADGTGLGGVVLTLEDLTVRAAAAERRDALLRALTEQTRGAVANIRAAAETMLEFPDMDAAGQQQFARIIEDEAQRLSAQLEQATLQPAEQLGDPSLSEDVLAGDLLAAIQRRVGGADGSVSGATVSVAPAPEDVWLAVDSFGVIRTVADLIGWLRTQHGAGNVLLRVAPTDRYAALDVRWREAPLDSSGMHEWSAQPAVRQWLDRHGCETWSGHDADGAYVRLLLPLAAQVPSAAERGELAGQQAAQPAGVAAGVTAGGTAEAPAERPQFYDFDLFRVPGEDGAEWDARALGELTYTVFDTETTGLAPDEGDEIVSIAAVRVVNRRVLRGETYEQLVDPRRRIPPASYAVHGISSDMVRGQPVIEEVLPKFARFAEDTVLVGHEVGFDMRFIRHKEDRAGVRFTQPVLDTRLLSAIVHPEQERHGLDAIAERLGVSVLGRHTALGDALVTAEVFVRLLGLLERQGLRTLGDVRAAAARVTVATTTFT